MNDQLLKIENLSVHFHIPEGVARAVDGISFHLAAGETIGLVGESGCGKSVTSLSILGLIDRCARYLKRGENASRSVRP